MRAMFVLLLAGSVDAAEGVTWRNDYAAGRKEASEANKPVCMVVGSDNCFYCRKLEASTLIDPTVTALLKSDYICIKIDGQREPEIAKALKITLYPTTVLADSEGNIHAIINGYVVADQFRDHLRKTTVAIADDARMEKDFKAAQIAFAAGDLAKAASLAKPLVSDFRNRPVQQEAKELIDKLDKAIAAKALVASVRPQALLDVAKQLHDAGRYADAIDVAEEVLQLHASGPEAKLAQNLMTDIKANAEKLKLASRQADEKAAALQLALSESHLKTGDVASAKACLDQVLRLTPTGPYAEAALVSLNKVKTGVIATPATLKK